MSKRERENKGNDKRESSVVTKESICSTLTVFSLLAILTSCTRSLIFGEFGKTVQAFLLGSLGYFTYPVLFGVLYCSVMGLLGKRLVKNRRLGALIWFALLFVGLFLHTALTYSWNENGYVKACFVAGENFPKATVCGALGGVIVYGASAVISSIGGMILFGALAIVCIYFSYRIAKKKTVRVRDEENIPAQIEAPTVELATTATEQAVQTPAEPEKSPYASRPIYEDRVYATPILPQRPGVSLSDNSSTKPSSQGFSPFGVQRKDEQPQEPYDSHQLLFGGTPAENYQKNLLFDPNARVNRRPNVTPTQSVFTPSYTSEYENSMNQPQVVRPTKVVSDRVNGDYFNETGRTVTPTPAPPAPIEQSPVYRAPEPETYETPSRTFDRSEKKEEPSLPINPVEEKFSSDRESRGMEYKRHDYMDLFSPSNPNVFGNEEENARFGRDFADRALSRERDRGVEENGEGRDGFRLFDEEETDPYTLRTDFDTPTRKGLEERSVREEASFPTPQRDRDLNVEERGSRDRGFVEETPIAPVAPSAPIQQSKPVEPPKPAEPPKPRIIRPYVRPRLDDFDCRDIEPMANDDEVRQTKESIIATLEEFKITGASIASVTFGPTVTRYNVTIPRSISPKKVVALDQSIAIDLHSSGVNIYPNYEDGVVSIEVPNKERQFVQLGCMLSGDTFVNAKNSSLMFAMGKDVANRKIYGDISKMIHLLVAGSSGSGKSVFLGALIISLIYKYSPEELRLILIDPKKTEFVLYNNLPHLMINEIITDAGKAVQSLNWAIGEMNRRYGLFEKMSRSGKYVVNLDQYNEQLEKAERLPKIVIIIDELADLMLAAKKDMEERIQNLTQKARAAGIHLIVATQRPSTDVITGVIKSNLATRVAFYVATDVDSRVILDQTGAQKLLGKGDFLYTMPGINVPVRVQSAFISPEESQRVVNFIKNNNEAYYDEEATAYINSRGGNGGDSNDVNGRNGNVDPLYIDALRYVISIGSASISMIQRKFSAGFPHAGKIVEWMEDMGYISPFDGARARKVLITKEEFESKYGPL